MASGGDCDDTHDHVHPGEPEVCNGQDDDCDGSVDDDAVDALAWYTDGDGDGYGDGADPVWACSAPPERVSDASDCDDSDPAIHPAALKSCEDGVDDCDGADCYTPARVLLDSVATCLTGEVEGDGAGNAVPLGDVSHRSLATAADPMEAMATGDELGQVLVSGYLNDDDLPDVIISDRSLAGGCGAYLVLNGPVSALPSSITGVDGTLLGDSSSDSIVTDMAILGDVDGDGAGYDASFLADTNGDSLDDLIVAGPGASDSGAGTGAAWLLLGPVSGAVSLAEARTRLAGRHEGQAVGWSARGAGDLDADGQEDLLFWAPGDNTAGAGAGALAIVPAAGL